MLLLDRAAVIVREFLSGLHKRSTCGNRVRRWIGWAVSRRDSDRTGKAGGSSPAPRSQTAKKRAAQFAAVTGLLFLALLPFQIRNVEGAIAGFKDNRAGRFSRPVTKWIFTKGIPWKAVVVFDKSSRNYPLHSGINLRLIQLFQANHLFVSSPSAGWNNRLDSICELNAFNNSRGAVREKWVCLLKNCNISSGVDHARRNVPAIQKPHGHYFLVNIQRRGIGRDVSALGNMQRAFGGLSSALKPPLRHGPALASDLA